MDLPEKGLELIKESEGCRLHRYTDLAGHSTIGYGHLCSSQDGLSIITQEQADELLNDDATISLKQVLKLTNVALNTNQQGALMSFVFNLGAHTYERSTLRQVINRNDFADVPEHLMRYCMAGGKKVYGLMLRRKAESNLFMEGI